MGKGPTQEDRVLAEIRSRGFINCMTAYNLGITQLGTRIFNLKRMGYRFKKDRQKGLNRHGKPTHWDNYMLDEDDQQSLF